MDNVIYFILSFSLTINLFLILVCHTMHKFNTNVNKLYLSQIKRTVDLHIALEEKTFEAVKLQKIVDEIMKEKEYEL